MNMLIAGRGASLNLLREALSTNYRSLLVAIQGFGGGGCLSVTEIIYADLVPLPERGKFQGITAS